MPEPAVLRREAPITAADQAARTLTVQLARWDQPRLVADPHRSPYHETWARDSLTPDERGMYVVNSHAGGELIGRMDNLRDGGTGPVADVHIAHTRAGDDLLALVDAEVVTSVSLEALADPGGEIWSDDRQAVTRTRALLRGVAFTFHPAHDAPILAREGDGTMPDSQPTTTPTTSTTVDVTAPGDGGSPDPTPGAATAPAPTPAAPAAGGDQAAAELVELRRQMTQLVARTPAAPARPRFAHLGEFMRAAALDLQRELPRDPMGGGALIQRELLDVTSEDVPGLFQPQQIRQLFDVIEANQPLANAASTVPAPTSLTYEYPRVTQRPLVAPQAAEKTDIVSRETKIESASVPVRTLAGGEDTSIQVLQLSDPSYLQIRAMLYAEAMAWDTDTLAIDTYVTNATIEASIGTDPAGWNQALFDIAGQILTTSRRFPNRLQLSTDLWVKLGGATDPDGRPLFTATSPVNPVGTASLTSPTGDVRELPYVVNPNLPDDTGLMFNDQAFRAGLGPVQTMTADVPSKLGQDYAMFRFGAFLAVDPAAMAVFHTATVAAPAKATAKKS